jgi:putative ATPase
LKSEKGREIKFSKEGLAQIARSGAGDVRRALNSLELCVLSADKGENIIEVLDEDVELLLKNSPVRYDRAGDEHYDIISAYQKSMRGSDPDAAIYYLARLLAAGDLPSACRRLLACANEDVGLAYPQIIPIVKAAVDTALMLGLPEGRLPLANAVILVATAPKSNSAHDAINAAMSDVELGKVYPIPRSLQNKHYDSAEVERKGQFYLYPHDFENHYVKQQYLPDELVGRTYYHYGENKTEQAAKAYWEKIKG